MSSDTEWQPVYISLSLRKSCSFWKYLKPSSGVYYSETRALKNFSGRLKWDVWFSRGYRNITHLPIFKLSIPPPETVPPLFLACSRSSDNEEWLWEAYECEEHWERKRGEGIGESQSPRWSLLLRASFHVTPHRCLFGARYLIKKILHMIKEVLDVIWW